MQAINGRLEHLRGSALALPQPHQLTSPDRSSKPEDSDHCYTLKCDEPITRFVSIRPCARTVDKSRRRALTLGSDMLRMTSRQMERRISWRTIRTESGRLCSGRRRSGRLLWANSPLSEAYFGLRDVEIGLDVGVFGLHMNLHHWINDGLMVVFFFVVGLEVRQEFAHGTLRDASRARLALIAGVAGVALPAVFYILIVAAAGGDGLGGWGAVVGTDTAFLLGALALVGPKLSGQLRVFLLTLTVVDDFFAVSIIGIVYSDEIRLVPLLIAVACLAGLWLLGRSRQWSATPYVLIVIVLWFATVDSGVHASLRAWSQDSLSPPTRRVGNRWSRLVSCSATSGSRRARHRPAQSIEAWREVSR